MAVYSWGANSHGQLGLGFESEQCTSPKCLSKICFDPEEICSIKGGGGHVIALDSTGQLHACGWNNRGQLGVNCTENKNEFICIPRKYFNHSPVEQIACGWETSGAITADKAVFIWGANNFQQLGVCRRGFPAIKQPFRFQLPRNEIPVQISFGLHYCCILTEDNIVYIFGKFKARSSFPDLKISTIFFNKVEITKLQIHAKIESISCGQRHFIMILDNATVIGVGDNKFGQSNCFTFSDKIKYASAGWTHNGVLTETGDIFVWGRNCYGQLATKFEEDIKHPLKLNYPSSYPCRDLHMGSEHGLAVSMGDQVFTWGWNEHGNCGNGSVENLFSPTLIDLPYPSKIAGTGAGFCYAICENK